MATNEKNIVLAGFMATGKTTVGTILAQKVGRVFFDVDTAIEHRTGLTIPRIFANHSEPFFRAIEKGICHEISLQKNLVVATGGGAIMDEDSRTAFLKTAFVVNLNTTPETIEARLRASDMRPLAGEWRKRFDERKPIYDALPNQIDTDDKTPEQIAEEIMHLWQKKSA